ncbi:hypothetical protein UFOVP407_52 [uncultured Caudovirales phage]|uniref:Scaffolding protein n=1 Tax=uncultured Caudovirales phage TaxID=2100421 RepID=A0A6J5M5J8_9CAUD|nr:hypothetical protein UFOVP407_52 [uncultured Caudovirales phage]
MTTEPEIDDDVLDLEEFEDDDLPEADEDDGEDADPDDGDDGDQGEDEQPESNATIRRMRAEIRQLRREKREAQSRTVVDVEDPGPRPKLEDFDYDEDRHAEAVETWAGKKFAAQQAAQAQQADDPITKDWNTKLTAFQEARVAITTQQPDAEDVLMDVNAALDAGQMASIVQAFKGERAVSILLKIGADADTLERFADIRNPLELVAEAARLEAPAMTRKKPAIDAPVKGKAPTAGPANKTLEKLEAEAARTGDRTKLIRYRKQLRERGKSS